MTTENSVPQKRCPKCGGLFPPTLEYFHKDKHMKDGLRTICKSCACKSGKRNNKLIRLQSRECLPTHKRCTKCGNEYPRTEEYWHCDDGKYHAWCKKCKNAAGKEYYDLYPEKSAQACKNWYLATIDDRREFDREKHRIYYSKNRDVIKQRVKEYNKNNPDKRREHHSKRRALKKKAQGQFSELEIKQLYEKQDRLCFHCGADLTITGFHRDHWIPLDRGGTNWISNIRLLCPDCNLSKHNKLPHEWRPERYSKDD